MRKYKVKPIGEKFIPPLIGVASLREPHLGSPAPAGVIFSLQPRVQPPERGSPMHSCRADNVPSRYSPTRLMIATVKALRGQLAL